METLPTELRIYLTTFLRKTDLLMWNMSNKKPGRLLTQKEQEEALECEREEELDCDFWVQEEIRWRKRAWYEEDDELTVYDY